MTTSQCAILIGGMGSRLGQLTRETPKPLLRVAGIPFLELLVGEAMRRGFTDIVFLAGYKASRVGEFADALAHRLPGDCRLQVSVEPEPLGTGGAVAHAGEMLADTFLLLNGDSWFDFNWLDLVGVAGDRNAVAARHVARADRHERLCIEKDGRVTAIVPRSEGSGAALVNGGVYVFRRSVFQAFSGHFSIESDVLPELIRHSDLLGREYGGFFLDIGIPEALEAAQIAVPSHRRRPALFLDRDGVLNHDDNYVGSVQKLRWIDGAASAVRLANELGFYVFVVTNQAGVARGLYDEAAVQSLHRSMAAELRQHSASIDDWRYCPYHPDGTIERYASAHPWRKPEPGMILDLLATWPVDSNSSILIGDKESDCAAARAAGITPFQFTGGNLHDFVAPLLAARSERVEED